MRDIEPEAKSDPVLWGLVMMGITECWQQGSSTVTKEASDEPGPGTIQVGSRAGSSRARAEDQHSLHHHQDRD